MNSPKMSAGQVFPPLSVDKLGGGKIDLSIPVSPHDWKLVVVYRGKHCPVCTRYLQTLDQILPEINQLGIDVVAVSADSEQRTADHMTQVSPSFDIGYGLTIEQMKQLGLYISDARVGMDAEVPFAEPAHFVINEEGKLQIINISNVPFGRPDLNSLLMGLKYLRNLTEIYPVNGSFE